METNAVLALRMPLKTRQKLDLLAKATGRTRSFLALDAICSYVDVQSWQVQETKKALQEAEASDFASPKQVKKILGKWKVHVR